MSLLTSVTSLGFAADAMAIATFLILILAVIFIVLVAFGWLLGVSGALAFVTLRAVSLPVSVYRGTSWRTAVRSVGCEIAAVTGYVGLGTSTALGLIAVVNQMALHVVQIQVQMAAEVGQTSPFADAMGDYNPGLEAVLLAVAIIVAPAVFGGALLWVSGRLAPPEIEEAPA